MSFKPAEKWLEIIRALRHRRLAARRFQQTSEWFSSKNEMEGPVLFDIGARAGISEPYDRLSIIRGFRSVGFEPDSSEAEKLRAAGSFNFVCPVALGAREEKRILYIAKDPGCSSLFPPDGNEIARHTTWRAFETEREIEVRVKPLDEAIKQYKLPLPDFLKIDCEGAEGEVFDGAPDALGRLCGLTFEARFRQFYRGGSTLSQLIDRMFDLDFICLRLDPIGSFSGSLMMFDVVMVRHPNAIRDQRQFVLCLIFCLLQGNWRYAQWMAQLGAEKFGCDELRSLFLK